MGGVGNVQIDNETVGIAVESIGRAAELIRMLSPQHIELVCGEHEDTAQLRRDIEFLVLRGSVH